MIPLHAVVLFGPKNLGPTGVEPVASSNVCHFALIALTMETMRVMTINFTKANQVVHVIVETLL